MGFAREFKEFAIKGNAIDIAIGLVIGAAFAKIVNSIVTDIIMPPVGLLVGGVEFKDLQYVLREAVQTAEGSVPAVAIRWGAFVDTVIEFLIIALAVFVVIKMMNRMIRQRGVTNPAVAPAEKQP